MAQNSAHTLRQTDRAQRNEVSPWILASAAPSHMTNDQSYFSSYSHIEPIRLRTVTGDSMQAIGKGTIVMKFTYDGTTRFMVLADALYVPSLNHNAISLNKLTAQGQFSRSEQLRQRQ